MKCSALAPVNCHLLYDREMLIINQIIAARQGSLHHPNHPPHRWDAQQRCRLFALALPWGYTSLVMALALGICPAPESQHLRLWRHKADERYECYCMLVDEALRLARSMQSWMEPGCGSAQPHESPTPAT